MLGFGGETGKFIGMCLNFDTSAFDTFCKEWGVELTEYDIKETFEDISLHRAEYRDFGCALINNVACRIIKKYVAKGLDWDKFVIWSQDTSYPSMTYDGEPCDPESLKEKIKELKDSKN